MFSINIIIFTVVMFLLCFLWRILPLLKQPHQGCDAYFYLIAIEVFKKNKKIPILMPPYYVMEYQESWYPPGFIILLSLLKKRIIDKIYWLISPALDSVLCCLLYLFMCLYNRNGNAALIIILIYIFSRAAIDETISLTSRQAGALLLNILFISSILFISNKDCKWLLVIALISGILLLMTHKLSTQVFYISFVIMSIIFFEITFIVIIVIVFLSTILLSKGFYIKILRSHVDFIKFWSRNWKHLGAHQLNDSIIYGIKKKQEITSPVYRKDVRKNVLKNYCIDNLYAVFPFSILLLSIFNLKSISKPSLFFAGLSLTILMIGLLSYIIPYLRGIGLINQYGKLALPIALICAIDLYKIDQLTILIYVIVSFYLYQGIISLYNIIIINDQKSSTEIGIWDYSKLDKLFRYLQTLNDPLIMCIPLNYCDLIAFHCRKRVLWGGHTSPTSNLQSVLPVFSKSLSEIINEWSVTHLLVDRIYCEPEIFNINAEVVWEKDSLVIYEFNKL